MTSAEGRPLRVARSTFARELGFPVRSVRRVHAARPPPPTRYMPRTRKSWDNSGGAFDRHRMTDATIDEMTSSMANRTSSGVRSTVFGRPVMRSRPRTSAWFSSCVGSADPICDLDLFGCPLADSDCRVRGGHSSGWRHRCRTTRRETASRATMPPSEINRCFGGATTDVNDHVADGFVDWQIGADRCAPSAVRSGWRQPAPARRAASVTARRSTSVIADGTQMTTLGRVNRLTPTRCNNRRIIRSVISKSVMAPPRNGRTATM